MNDGSADFDRIKAKLEGLLSGMAEDLKFAGEAAASMIVQTTLAGIGEDDRPFAPYSQAYEEVIQSVGGKPGGVVNLRGIFYHQGQKRYRGKKNLGQGRRAYNRVGFNSGGSAVEFYARTQETRPMRGMIDKLSEMSLDLIKVSSTDNSLSLIYEPRENPYMIRHHLGDGRGPRRPWFTLRKKAVKAALMESIRIVVEARVTRFNVRSA